MSLTRPPSACRGPYYPSFSPLDGGTRLYPRCYGSSEISLRNSDSAQAPPIRQGPFPREPSASATFATVCARGVSTMRRRSSSPEVRYTCLISSATFLASSLAALLRLGASLTLRIP